MAAMKKDIKEFACFIYKLKKDFIPAYRALFRAKAGHRRWLSPLKKGAMNRAGGYSYREAMSRDIWAIVIVSCVMGIFLSVTMLASLIHSKPLFWALVVLVASAALSARVLIYQGNNYFLGHLGERAVGDELDKVVARPQWRVFHNFDIGFGDIDHIIVCPKGVFCVETKTLRKHPDKTEKIIFRDGALWRNDIAQLDNPDPIKQAKRNAANLHSYMDRECYKPEGEKTDFVASIIAFPDWGVEIIHGHHDKDVVPCNPKAIGQVLSSRPDKLSSKQIERICVALEKKNRIELTDAP